MTETRNDPDFVEMLEERKRSLSASITGATYITVVVAIILLGMFFFLT